MVNCFDSDDDDDNDDDDDDDILLNAAPTFSKRRSRRAEDKSVENGFAKLCDALKKPDRRQQKSENKIRCIKREMPEIVDDEDEENNNYFLAKVESIVQQAVSNKKSNLCSDSWMVASEDMDNAIVPVKELIARASARNAYGASKSGAREIFNRSSSASETDSRLDPVALLENCLQKLKASHKLRSKVHTEIIQPIRAAMKASHLNSFLNSSYLERHTLPSEFMLWLRQVAISEPCKGHESKELCEQAFLLVKKLWKEHYLASFGTKLLNIADLLPQLEKFTYGPSIALRLSKFLQIWGLALRCGVGIAPDVTLGDAVRSCVVALIRAGIDQVFYNNSARSLLSDLWNLICGLIDLACPAKACDDDWMKETALKVLCVENLGPNIETGDASWLLSLALAVDITPIKGSHNAAELKAFMAICSLQICLCAADWEFKVQAVLTSWQEDKLANKVTTSLDWKAFASAFVTVTELMDSSATAEKDGPRLLAVLQIVTSCMEAVFALTQNADEVEALYQALPMFEHNILVLSKVSQHNKLDSHFSSAEHKLELLRRLCQSSQLQTMTPTAVKIQMSMFDFLTPKPQMPFDRNDTPIVDYNEIPVNQTATLIDCKEIPVDQTETTGNHIKASPGQKETTDDHIKTSPGQKETTGYHVETSPGLKETTGDHVKTSPGLKETTGDHVKTSPGLKETTGNHTPMDETEKPINHMEALVDMPIYQTETVNP